MDQLSTSYDFDTLAKQLKKTVVTLKHDVNNIHFYFNLVILNDLIVNATTTIIN